jgi:F420-dependent oxidoreductase-like protein
MKLALHLANLTLPGDLGPTLAAAAKAADDGGFAAITLMDHWFQMENLGGPSQPMIEGYAGLGFLAAHTSTIDLGLLVTGVTYRHPGLLAKIVTTIDVLSGGRAFLGLGAAWYEREHLGLGVPYPPTAERFERLEETIEICRQMWSEDDGPFHGKHYDLAETICVPQPLHRVPLLIGGSGEKKTLRLVARYADACNLFDSTPDEVAHKIDVLHGHCEAEGRDPAEVRITMVTGDNALGVGFVEKMTAYAALGVDQVWVGAHSPDPASWVAEAAAAVVPALAAI